MVPVSPAPAGGAVHRDGVKREGPGQVLPAAAEHLDPEVREAIARPGHMAGSAAAGQGFRGNVCGPGHSPEERGKIGAPAAEPEALLFQALRLLAEGFHERTTAQDALVGEVALPPPPEGLDGLPATHTPEQAPALEVRPPPLGHACRHEGPVALARLLADRAELSQDLSGRLPRDIPRAAERRVAAVGVASQGPEVRHHLGPEGIQVEVADEFQKIGFFFYDDGLVPILKEMPRALVAPVEGPRVPREERPHAPRQGTSPRPDQQVEVIRQEGPRVDREGVRLGEGGKAADEIVPVLVIAEDDLPVQPSTHHVVEDPRGIEARAARHSERENTIK